MINITRLKLASNGTHIETALSCDAGMAFSKILVWDEGTYKNYSLAHDMSNKLAKTTNSESLLLSLADIGIGEFKGLIFFEFEAKTTSGTVRYEKKTEVIGNLTDYHTCLTNRLLAIDIEKHGMTFKGECDDSDDWADCYPCQPAVPDSDCGCNSPVPSKNCQEITDNCGNSIFYINAALGMIYRAILLREFSKAAILLRQVKEVTVNCCTFGQENNMYLTIYTEANKTGLCVQKITRSS